MSTAARWPTACDLSYPAALIAATTMLATSVHTHADVQALPLAPGQISIGSVLSTFQVAGSGPALVRGFVVTGHWTSINASARSSEFRTRLSSDAPGFLPTNDRAMGGVNSSDPFTFGPGAALWGNGPLPIANDRHIRSELSRFAPASSTWTASLSQSFLGSQAELSDARLCLLTDATVPQTGDMSAPGLPTYQRASALSDFGQGTLAIGNYRFHSWEFTAPATGLYLVGATYRNASNSQTFDGVLSLYRGDFNPQMPLDNILALDSDNEVNGGGSAGSSIWIELTAGQRYTGVVSTQFDTPTFALGTGEFTSFVAGPVPTPGTIAPLGLGAWFCFRRRR